MDYDFRKNIRAFYTDQEDQVALTKAANDLFRKGNFEQLANLIIKNPNRINFLEYISRISGDVNFDSILCAHEKSLVRKLAFKKNPGIVLFLKCDNDYKLYIKSIIKYPRCKQRLILEINDIIAAHKNDKLNYVTSITSLYKRIATPPNSYISIDLRDEKTDRFHIMDICCVEVETGRSSNKKIWGLLPFLNLIKIPKIPYDEPHICALDFFKD